ncbi:glycine zipper 2TM domain-containing protein [Chitinivorax sp. PXF-14]|uniref:glycine zipper 2TM domain-containing protein n=1 Tax=Chitinivorax sp. PXF-14 TaxID=3230488 RepID=UPI00346711B2
MKIKLMLAALLVSATSFAFADATADYSAAKQDIDAKYKDAVKACATEAKSAQAKCKSAAKKDMQAQLAEARQQRDAAAKCADCGVVTAVTPYEVKGEGSAVGAVAGGLVGGLLGKQVGKGDGNKVATVAGAAAGAYGGYKAEEALKTKQYFEYTVKLNNGKVQKVKLNKPEEKAEFKVGDKIKLSGDGMVSN